MTTTLPTDTCNGKTADGLCPYPAGHRTPHPGIGRCSRHGGCTPSGRTAALATDLDQLHERHARTPRARPLKFGETDPQLAAEALALLSRHSVPPDR